MEEIFDPLISALIGVALTALVITVNNFFSFRAKVDENLREKRLEVYKVLWKKTSLLPKWPRNPDVTYEKLNKFSKELRDWYFDVGGYYLSEESRKAYEVVQDRISEIVDAHRDKLNARITYEEKEKDKEMSEYGQVRKACSALRTELTRDLQSRTRDFLSRINGWLKKQKL